jgi:hypothetical protein
MGLLLQNIQSQQHGQEHLHLRLGQLDQQELDGPLLVQVDLSGTWIMPMFAVTANIPRG